LDNKVFDVVIIGKISLNESGNRKKCCQWTNFPELTTNKYKFNILKNDIKLQIFQCDLRPRPPKPWL